MKKEEFKLKRLIERIEDIRGEHTELVSFYIPAGFNITKAIEQIRNEISTAQNIKSKQVRKNVIAALEKIEKHLMHYKQTPENGLVIFSGNVHGKIELFFIEPPEPLRKKLYWCNHKFVIEPLKNIFEEKDVYGIVLIDKSEADIGIIRGKSIIPIKHMDSLVPGKTSKGGWSQARYERIREGLLRDFMKNVAENVANLFDNYKEMKGIIIAGPGPVKNNFAEGDFLRYDLRSKILGVVDTAYTGTYGIEEAIERAKDILKKTSIVREKKIVSDFFRHIAKNTGYVVYGLKDVIEKLEKGFIDTLLISKTFNYKDITIRCTNCGEKQRIISDSRNVKCKKCKKDVEIIMEQDILDYIIDTAEKVGTKIEIISTDTKEGKQFEEFGKIAGILRFKV